jgi:hypothetical protein
MIWIIGATNYRSRPLSEPVYVFCYCDPGRDMGVMNDLGPSKHHLTSRYQLMTCHQLIKLLRHTRLAVMSAISPVRFDQRFDHARDQCHASIKLSAIEILVRVLFLPTLVSLLDIYSQPPDSIPLLYSVLLFRASSYVKAITHAQLNYSQVVQAHLRPSALVIILSPL